MEIRVTDITLLISLGGGVDISLIKKCNLLAHIKFGRSWWISITSVATPNSTIMFLSAIKDWDFLNRYD